MTFDLVVVGAGPAGMSAANNAASNGASVAIVDENPVPGGKLLGQLHEEANSKWWIGENIAREMAAQVYQLNISTYLEKEVWGIFPHWNVTLSSGEELITENVLIATGAAEKAIPVPGWTKPGVMAIGAAQNLTNFQRVQPGKSVAIIGIDPLALSVAHELKMAGVKVAGIFAPPSNELSAEQANTGRIIDVLASMSHLAPNKLLRVAGNAVKRPFFKRLAINFYPNFGVKVWGIPLHLKRAVREIDGEDQVERIKTAQINQNGRPNNKTVKSIDVDCVCISGGLYPLAELASSTGCDFAYINDLGGNVPLHSLELETTQDGIFVAGNVTGIEGAKVAIAQGKLAGTVISDRLGLLLNRQATVQKARDEVGIAREEAVLKFQPNIQQGRAKMERLWQAAVTD